MYKTIKSMREALEEARAYRDPVNEDKGFSSQQIKMAYGVLNDPRYKQGNYSGAVRAIEKIARGLSNHPDVANALKRANEELEEAKTAGSALAQGHLEKMTDQRFKEFYGMTKDEYIKKHGDPRKEELDKDDKETIKPIIKQLQKSVKAHDRQAKQLQKDIQDEVELDEALEVKWDSNKQGWFDKQGRRRYLGKMATNKLMSKAIDKAKETGDFINPFKLKHGQKPEETIKENKSSELINLYQIKNKTPEIEARIAKLEKELKVIKREETELEENFQNFTKADFAKLEADNEHGEAAEKLVQKFGTKEERNIIAVINIRHHKTGYISGPDFRERTRIVNKYYSRLK